MIITIDGPAGSGKSTLSVALSKHLSFFCLNSGYLYRGIAYVLITYYRYTHEKLQHPDIADVQACFDSGQFRYDYVHGVVKVFWGDDEITQFLKDPSCAKAASIIAQDKDIRLIVRAYKRMLAESKDSVVEGRVCGSVVFPDAQIKLYVTASLKVRAGRFYKDQHLRGNDISMPDAIELVRARDHVDMTRSYDPLVQPHGAFVIDTSDISKDQALEKVLDIVRDYMHSR